jgi:hypothetical protein
MCIYFFSAKKVALEKKRKEKWEEGQEESPISARPNSFYIWFSMSIRIMRAVVAADSHGQPNSPVKENKPGVRERVNRNSKIYNVGRR